MDNLWIFAQTTAVGESEEPSVVTAERVDSQKETAIVVEPNTTQPVPGVRPRPNPFYQYLPLIVVFIVFYLLMFRGPRKKQQQQKRMIQSLKKNDRVRTIGGIIGTIVEVKDDEIVLKVDESSNTKIRIVPNAINRNISQDDD
jgi:preprotein translocase subunit YajC